MGVFEGILMDGNVDEVPENHGNEASESPRQTIPDTGSQMSEESERESTNQGDQEDQENDADTRNEESNNAHQTTEVPRNASTQNPPQNAQTNNSPPNAQAHLPPPNPIRLRRRTPQITIPRTSDAHHHQLPPSPPINAPPEFPDSQHQHTFPAVASNDNTDAFTLRTEILSEMTPSHMDPNDDTFSHLWSHNGQKPILLPHINKKVKKLRAKNIHTDIYVSDKLLWFIPQTNIIRRLAAVVLSPHAERLILLLIIVNTIILAIYDPLNPDSVRNSIVLYSEIFFIVMYTVEMILKMISLGGIGYFWDRWNVLDLIVVIAGIGSLFTWINGFAALRLVRILRPLRAIFLVPDLRILVQSFLSSVGLLCNAFCIFILFLWVFALIGLHWFNGAWRQFCHHNHTDEILDPTRHCTMEPVPVGVVQGHLCPESYTCRRSEPLLSHGFQNFDSLPFSLLSVLESITFGEWYQLSSRAADTLGELSRVFFMSIVFFSALFVLNLVLGITIDSYRKFNPNSKQFDEDKMTSILTCILRRIDSLYSKIKCPSPYRKLQKFGRRLLTSAPARLVLGGLVLLNTVVLTIEHYGMSSKLNLVLDIINITFVGVFAVDLVVMLLILGLRDFFRDKFNVFDSLVVLICLVEIPIWRSAVFSVLLILRLFRVPQLFGSSRGLKRVTKSVTKSVLSAFFLTALFGLFVLYFSLMGLQLFGGKLGSPSPRANFDNMFNALITVFIIITGDEWNDINYEVMWKVHPAACTYFIALVLAGAFVVINLFVAILMQHVTVVDCHDDDVKGSENGALSPWAQCAQLLRGVYLRIFWEYVTVVYRVVLGHKPSPNSIMPSDETVNHVPSIDDLPSRDDHSSAAKSITVTSDEFQPKGHTVKAQQPSIENDTTTEESPTDDVHQSHHHDYEKEASHFPAADLPDNGQNTWKERFVHYITHDPLQYERSLFLFPPDLWIRKRLIKLITHQYFEGLLVCIIIGSCVCFALQTPYLDPNSSMYIALSTLSIIFAIFFALEAIIKILLFGLVLHPSAYMRSVWNVLDFCIMLADVFGSFFMPTSIANIQVVRLLRTLRLLRGFRTLRLLRLFHKIDYLRRLVDGLLNSIWTLGYMVFLAVLVFTIFAVFGVHLFGGCFYSCSDSTFTTRQTCIDSGHEWVNARSHFDNFPAAMLSLFEMSTLNGWSFMLWRMMDVTGVDEAPRTMASPWNALFGVAFVLFGTCFLLTLFVGVVVGTNQEGKGEHKKESTTLTITEQRWLSILQRIQRISSSHWPRIPSQWWRVKLYRMLKSNMFEMCVLGMVVVDAIFMSLESYNESHAMHQVQSIASTVFTALFTVEILLKVVAFGPYHYLRTDWFVIVTQLLSVVGAILKFTVGPKSLITKLFQTFRMVRLLRLLKRSRSLRSLTDSLLTALSELLQTTCLLALFMFIYAMIGFGLFGRASRAGAEVLSDRLNFDSLWHSMLAIFALSTGEHWIGLMHDYVAVGDPLDSFCSDKRGDCVSAPPVTVLFFCSFILIGAFIVTQLFSAVIVHNFSTVREEDETLTDDDIKDFINQWSKIDQDLSLFIPAVKLPQLLLMIGSPLGVGPGAQIHSRLKYILSNLKLRVYIADIHFYDTLRALAELKFGAVLPADMQDEVNNEWDELIRRKKKLRMRTRSPHQFWLPNMRMLFFPNILDEEHHVEIPQTGFRWSIVQYLEHKAAILRVKSDTRIVSALVGLSSAMLLDVDAYPQARYYDQLSESGTASTSRERVSVKQIFQSPLKHLADQFLRLASVVPEDDGIPADQSGEKHPMRRMMSGARSNGGIVMRDRTHFEVSGSYLRKAASSPQNWMRASGEEMEREMQDDVTNAERNREGMSCLDEPVETPRRDRDPDEDPGNADPSETDEVWEALIERATEDTIRQQRAEKEIADNETPMQDSPAQDSTLDESSSLDSNQLEERE